MGAKRFVVGEDSAEQETVAIGEYEYHVVRDATKTTMTAMRRLQDLREERGDALDADVWSEGFNVLGKLLTPIGAAPPAQHELQRLWDADKLGVRAVFALVTFLMEGFAAAAEVVRPPDEPASASTPSG